MSPNLVNFRGNHKMSPVLMSFEYFTYQLPYKEYLVKIFKFCPFLCYQLISEHFNTFKIRLKTFLFDLA